MELQKYPAFYLTRKFGLIFTQDHPILKLMKPVLTPKSSFFKVYFNTALSCMCRPLSSVDNLKN